MLSHVTFENHLTANVERVDPARPDTNPLSRKGTVRFESDQADQRPSPIIQLIDSLQEHSSEST